MRKTSIAIILYFVFICISTDETRADDLLSSAQIVFVTTTAARDYLKREDPFLLGLSSFDRSARLKTRRTINNMEFLGFVSEQACDWAAYEKEKISDIMYRINLAFSDYNLLFPEEIVFIKTTGLEEGNAAYCRGNNVIVLPINYVNLSADRLYDTILHELFHIYSRNNSGIQEKLYEIISFKKCNELILPDEIFQWKITNPDSAVNNHFFSSGINGKNYELMPILLASSDYDEQKGGVFFDYMGLYFIAITDNGNNKVPLIENNRYCIFTLNQVPDCIRLVGRNTNYIIHPEEILADNFVFLINKTEDLPDMAILEKMRVLLRTP